MSPEVLVRTIVRTHGSEYDCEFVHLPVSLLSTDRGVVLHRHPRVSEGVGKRPNNDVEGNRLNLDIEGKQHTHRSPNKI